MKKTVLLACTLLFSFGAFAQSNSFYYYKGKQKALTIDKSLVNVFTTTSFQKSSVANLTTKDFELKNTSTPTEKWTTVDFGSQLSDVEFIQKVNALRNNPNVVGIGYHYKSSNGKSVGTSNLFYIKLKKADDLPLLQQQATAKNVVITGLVGQDPTWYGLKTTKQTTETTVEVANKFIETRLFEEMDPGFMLHFVLDDTRTQTASSNPTHENTTANCTNDTDFPQQWGLNNVANPAVDINACEAWAIPGATGSGVRVGVVDTGIKLNHSDLIENLFNESYDSNTQTQPSQLTDYPPYYYYNNQQQHVWYKNNHGTHVAGIIGARGNNHNEISGVAPQCTIVAVSNTLMPADEFVNTTISLGKGIEWAVQKEADIINCSWYADTGDFSTTYLESSITNALNSGRDGKGSIVVFASGNLSPTTNYPSYIDPRIMVVGAINNTGVRWSQSAYEVDTNNTEFTSNSIDVVAPGVDIRSTIVNLITILPSTGLIAQPSPNDVIDQRVSSGTSMAAPHVSGTAALMLSVNPCLTGQQIRDIIEQTAQKIRPDIYNYSTTAGRPNGTWNNEMGYGLIDAYAATQMAKSLASTHLDLYIKDNVADLGAEPNTSTTTHWNSPNIWVRNNLDNGTTHQAPKYNQVSPNYVYVKVENKSCYPTNGNQKVKLYYSRPTTGTPTTTSSAFHSSFMPVTGTEWVLIDEINISELQAGEDTTLMFAWTLPDPISLNSCTSIKFNTSLLAKIVANNDSNTFTETNNVLNNIKNNNNIAGKNLIVIDANYFAANETCTENSLLIVNPFNESHNFSIEMVKEDLETGKPIYQEAEVSFKMDEALYNAWERGGKTAQNIEATAVESKKMVTNNHVLINTISLNANELATLQLNFNFLTKELTDKSKYLYHIIQRDLATNAIVSAVAFEINKEPRPVFEAIADDKEKDRNETITISAQQISEPALYNWYDADGNLIFQGKDLTIATQVAQKYKLEVIATADGFKDYTEVEVNLKPSVLISMAPNPATDAVTIGYKINEGGSAYLMILGGYGTNSASNNYILDNTISEKTINLTNYSTGFYTVALVVNGQIVDAKTLVKE